MKFPSSLLVLLLLLQFQKLMATCIIVVQTDTSVYIGADSKRTMFGIDRNSDKIIPMGFQEICKIYTVGNKYYAVSGQNDSLTRSCAQEANSIRGNIKGVIKVYDELMQKRYLGYLRDMSIENPSSFTSRMKEVNGKVAYVVFVSIENNIPKAYIISHEVVFKDNIPIKMQMHVVNMYDEMIESYILGIYRGIEDVKNYVTPSTTLVEHIKLSLEIVVKHNSESVGPPIKILEITSKGKKWLLGKQPCDF